MVVHKESEWLDEVKGELKDVPKKGNVSISKPNLQKQLSRTASWKSPGPDGIHGYWLKNFSSLHQTLCSQLNNCLSTKETPEWLTTGRTVLLMKDPTKGNIVSNYRPIACLNISFGRF